MDKSRIVYGAALASVLGGGFASPAYAQVQASSEETPSPSSGEIVVTALKGGVSVQRAPITVNIVSGEAIVDKGVTSVEQLTVAVPGIRVSQSVGGLINPVVRGLGSSPSNNSFEQTVGLFIDGIFAGHPRDYSAALFDLDRVELLKGTQSAVVGKNTSVGAMSLVTAKPTFELGGAASYYHEFELGTDTLTAHVNVPLSDTIAVRLAGLYSDEGGWIRRVLVDEDAPKVTRKALRATIRIRPNSALDWTISAQYSDYKQVGEYFTAGIDVLGNAALSAARGGDPNFVVRRYESRNTPRPGFVYRGFTDGGGKNDGTRLTSTINYQLGSTTLTSITGYSEYKDTVLLTNGPVVRSPVLRGGHETDEAFSQELRVATDANLPISVIAGAYYYYDKWSYEDLFNFNAAQLVAPPLGGAFTSSYRQKTKTASLFGQILYKITDNFQLAGGVRYEHFKKSGKYSDRVTLIPGGLTAAVYAPYAAFQRHGSKDYVDYSAQAQYFFAPDANAYVSFATGTKGFGFVATPSSPGGVVTEPSYSTEQSETWEAGVKLGLGGGSHINLAVFKTRIKDYQIAVNLGTFFVVRNDQVRSQGVEGNLDLRLLDGLQLAVAVTYADVEKLGPVPANSIPGLPFAPKWSGLGTLSYVSPYHAGFRFKSDLSMEFRTAQQLSDAANFPIHSDPGRVRTDLRLAVEHERSGVELAFVARNIFNDYSLSYGANMFGVPGAGIAAPEMPRTLGVQLSFRY